MSKAIAIHAVFLIAALAIFLFFIVAIFWGWIGSTKDITSEASCKASLINHCSALGANIEPPSDWNTACGQKPTIEDCCAKGFKSVRCII